MHRTPFKCLTFCSPEHKLKIDKREFHSTGLLEWVGQSAELMNEREKSKPQTHRVEDFNNRVS